MKQLKKMSHKALTQEKKATSSPTVLGPVDSLEDHVKPDWWCNIFNSLYLKTDADVVEDLNITRKEVNLFSKVINLTMDDMILDLCCGQGRHALEITKRGFKVEGLDRSRYLIQKAKASAKKENLNIKRIDAKIKSTFSQRLN